MIPTSTSNQPLFDGMGKRGVTCMAHFRAPYIAVVFDVPIGYTSPIGDTLSPTDTPWVSDVPNHHRGALTHP